ncbi:MAG: sialate O-acetylesterase [Pirellula sp.]
MQCLLINDLVRRALIKLARWSNLIVILLLACLDQQSIAANLELLSPLDYQVIQRKSIDSGSISIVGRLPSIDGSLLLEARIVTKGKESQWHKLTGSIEAGMFRAILDSPAGGWHRLEVRASSNEMVVAEGFVEHVGIGEVFVVAGQSNSANHGEEKQVTETSRVAAFDGVRWQIANDPQPGASGNRGSFMPALGDAIVKRFDVPVGFIACGIGATSVREWLPKGVSFPNPPTIESRVEKTVNGSWQSKGDAFANFVARMKSTGTAGFRAVLWHQGESDANQRDTTRTLAGNLYREYLTTVIQVSRREIGWPSPWFVAQASYHVPGDEASPDIRAAQASMWESGIAIEGPDSDALKGDLRENNGQGVHFSAKGLREHGKKWADKVGPWIERHLAGKS